MATKWPKKLLHPLQEWCDRPSCKACKIKMKERLEDWVEGKEIMDVARDSSSFNLDHDGYLNAQITAFNVIQNIRRENEAKMDTFKDAD